jgi:hypothetical protein
MVGTTVMSGSFILPFYRGDHNWACEPRATGWCHWCGSCNLFVKINIHGVNMHTRMAMNGVWMDVLNKDTVTEANLFDVHVTVHRVKFLIIKPTRCTDFSNLFSERNSTCFGQFLCPSSGVFHCTHRNGVCHTACEQYQDGTEFHPDATRKLSVNLYDILLLCVQWTPPDAGQRNCPKHVEFRSENKFEKSLHLI